MTSEKTSYIEEIINKINAINSSDEGKSYIEKLAEKIRDKDPSE